MKMNFSRNLAAVRRSQNITQEAMAEKCGVSRQAVTKWESGSSLPDLYKFSDIAEILGVTLDELLHGNMENKAEEQIDIDYATKLESKMDSILAEIRKQQKDILDRYDGYDDGGMESNCTDEEIPVVALRYLGIDEAQKGNYDDAIDFLEQALVLGDIHAVGILIGIYQDTRDFFFTEQDEYEYYQQELMFSQKIQKYGRIMESEIKKRIKFM